MSNKIYHKLFTAPRELYLITNYIDPPCAVSIKPNYLQHHVQ